MPTGFAAHLMGGISHETVGRRLRVPLGDMGSGEKRLIYAQVLAPASEVGKRQELNATLAWTSEENSTSSVAVNVEYAWTTSEEAKRAPRDEEMRQRVGVVDLETEMAVSLLREKSGDLQGAMHAMKSKIAKNAQWLSDDQRAEYDLISDRLGRGLDSMERKNRDYESYKKRHSRE